MNVLEKFYESLKKEVETIQLSSTNGGTQENAFTRVCLDMLNNSQDTQNAVVAFDERDLGTKNQQRINGFAVSESFDAIDLFISEFEPTEEIETLEKRIVDRAFTRVTNFFVSAYSNNYYSKLAETSSVFEISEMLANSKELRDKLERINVFLLTNRKYSGELPITSDICGKKVFYNLVDINKLYSVSEQAKLPIQINFSDYNVSIPCLKVNTSTDDYDGYLAVLPGNFLADLYDHYRYKLLEQNVRSFLQFRAEINKGIKKTITTTPQMFFAYNNGLSATADSIELSEDGKYITSIYNFQIVNGGQTTASLYYARAEAKDLINNVSVSTKISVVKNPERAYELVSNISTFANTQNKINDADLSANHPIFAEIERLSRYMLTPKSAFSMNQHYWFFDRSKRLYDNLASDNSSTKARKKAFEMKYPKECKFNIPEMAKYINSFNEVIDQDKIVVGPHTVVDGNEPNFRAFRDYILPDLKITSVFYEDLIAKAIVFRDATNRHGTKRSKTGCLSDMRQVLVPYSIALLNIATKGRLDFHKIWLNQRVFPEVSDYLFETMKSLLDFLRKKAAEPDTFHTNIIEWATKEDCWKLVKEQFPILDASSLSADIIDKTKYDLRYREDDLEDLVLKQLQEKLIISIGDSIWREISVWGKDSGCLDINDQNMAANIAHKLQFNYDVAAREFDRAYKIYAIVAQNNHELLCPRETLESAFTPAINIDHKVRNALAWFQTLSLLPNWQFSILQYALKNGVKENSIMEHELNIIFYILEQSGFNSEE